MRKRVPVDIQFLYEGIFNEPVIKEDPDYVGSCRCGWTDDDVRSFLYDPNAKKDLTGDDYRARHMKKHAQGHDFAAQANYYSRQSDGVERKGNLLRENPEYMSIPNPKNPEYGNIKLEYGMDSARSFVYFTEHDLYIEGEVNDVYHSDIVHAIVLGTRESDKLEWARCNFKIKGKVESFDKLKEEKLKMGTSFTNFSDREDPRMFGFLGRSWVPFNAMSFWCHQGWHEKLMDHGVIEKVIDFVGLDKNKPLYVGYGNTNKALLVGGKKTKEDEMSPEEYKALQAKQHLDPEAKKKLSGDDYRALAAKKRSMGFDYPAQANYYGRQSDGVIKMGQLLESPDEVYLVPDKETPDLDARTKGAYPFIYEPHDGLMFIPAKRGDRTFTVHSEMFETLHEVKMCLENEATEIEDAYKAFADGSIWNKKCYVDRSKRLIYAESHRVDDPFVIQYHGSDKALVDYLFNTMQIWEDNRGMEDVRESDLGIQGRVWERHNVLAIWNPTHEMVEFKRGGVMDKIISILSLDAKTLRVSPGDTVEVVDYASLEGGDIKKMTDAEYRELLKKQHLDADAKRKLADLDGERSYSKKQLGGYDYMAQKNFYSRQSDGIISLKSLIG